MMWYYAQSGKTFGPVTLDKLKELAREGTLKPSDHVVPVGSQEWKPASSLPDVFAPPTARAAAPAGPPPMVHQGVVGDRPPPRAMPIDGLPARRPHQPEPDSWSLDSQLGRPGFGPPEISFGRRVGRHFSRLFTWNLQRIQVDDDEKEHLLRNNVEDLTLQRYLVWRRSILFVLVVPVFLLALLSTVDALTEIPPLTSLGTLLLVLGILLPFALPFSAGLALIVWHRSKLSWRLLLFGWIIATALPLLLYVAPVSGTVDIPQLLASQGVDAEMARDPRATAAIRVFVGAAAFGILIIQLFIFALTAAIGVQRACLRLKTLLPLSSIPGLFLAAAAPLFAVLYLPFFVLASQAASNFLLYLGMLCLIFAPLLYAFFFKTLIRPFLTPGDFSRLRLLQISAVCIYCAGLFFLLLYAFIEPFPIPAQQNGQFVVHERTILGFNSETSLLRPWSWQLLRWMIVEFFGRSLFTMVLVTDIFMRINSYVWLSNRTLEGSDAGESYDQLMERLQTSGRWPEEARTAEGPPTMPHF